jgi:hypothetical protein
MDAHVLVYIHLGAQEKIFHVARAVAGTSMSIGDDAVEVEFGVGDADGGGSNVLVSVEAIAADCRSDAIDFGFARAHGTNECNVSDFAACRDLVGFNEKHGVVANNLLTVRSVFSHALHASTPFVGEGACPDLGVGSSEKGVDSFGASGNRIEHLSGDGGIVLDGLGEKEVWDAAVCPGIKTKAGEAGPGTLAVRGFYRE